MASTTLLQAIHQRTAELVKLLPLNRCEASEPSTGAYEHTTICLLYRAFFNTNEDEHDYESTMNQLCSRGGVSLRCWPEKTARTSLSIA